MRSSAATGTAVFCEAPITFTQAVLGGTLEIPTIDGKVKYDIPEGTQTGNGLPPARQGHPRPQRPRPGRPVCHRQHRDAPEPQPRAEGSTEEIQRVAGRGQLRKAQELLRQEEIRRWADVSGRLSCALQLLAGRPCHHGRHGAGRASAGGLRRDLLHRPRGHRSYWGTGHAAHGRTSTGRRCARSTTRPCGSYGDRIHAAGWARSWARRISSFDHAPTIWLTAAPGLDFVIGSVHMSRDENGCTRPLLYRQRPRRRVLSRVSSTRYLDGGCCRSARSGDGSACSGHLTLPVRCINEIRGKDIPFRPHMAQVEEILRIHDRQGRRHRVQHQPRPHAAAGRGDPARSTAVWAARSSPSAPTRTPRTISAAPSPERQELLRELRLPLFHHVPKGQAGTFRPL